MKTEPKLKNLFRKFLYQKDGQDEDFGLPLRNP